VSTVAPIAWQVPYTDLNSKRPMFDFAVQPASFGSFDPHGCLWATDASHAYRLGRLMATTGEDQVIWKAPHSGHPMKWATVAGEGVA
jgi:hypothetical protein